MRWRVRTHLGSGPGAVTVESTYTADTPEAARAMAQAEPGDGTVLSVEREGEPFADLTTDDMRAMRDAYEGRPARRRGR